MKEIFYTLAIIPIIYELTCIYNARKFHNRLIKLRSFTREPNKKLRYFERYVLAYSFYLSWLIVGLLTFQWQYFLILLVMKTTVKNSLIQRKLDSIISVGLIIFVVLNTFYLKIIL